MTDVIKEWDAFEIVAVPLGGALPLRSIKRGKALSTGESLARHPGPLKGDVHSPIHGQILEINEREIVIRRDDEAIGKTPAPLSLADLNSSELAQALKYLGLDIPEVAPGEPFIIQTFDAEPGLSGSAALFSEYRETMLAALEALNTLYPEHPQVWAIAEPGQAPEGANFKLINADYPYTLPDLVKPRITGRRAVIKSGLFSGRDLYFIGRVWRTGLPVTRMPLTLGQADYFVPVGARIIDLLTFANMRPGPDDLVLKGGLVRGITTARLGRGLGKKDSALHLIKGKKLQINYSPCRSCGECTRVCPAGLNVARAGKFSPDHWLSGKFKEEFKDCFQCGACAMVCPSRRPLLSLVRL